MRELTIRREKRYAGSIGKVKIYLEDPMDGDLEIKGVKYRKLGVLKNGEERTFSVGCEAARVYAVTGRVTPNAFREFYLLPAGEDPLTLTGGFNSSLFSFSFLFDNNENPEVKKARRHMRNVNLVIYSLMVLTVFAAVFFIPMLLKAMPKTFRNHHFSITLNESFSQETVEGYSFAYGSSEEAVLVSREAFTREGSGEDSLREYAEQLIKAHGSEAAVQTENGLTGFVYEATAESGKRYCYFCYVFQTEDAFWLVQFAAEAEKAEQKKPLVEGWAKSIVFSE